MKAPTVAPDNGERGVWFTVKDTPDVIAVICVLGANCPAPLVTDTY